VCALPSSHRKNAHAGASATPNLLQFYVSQLCACTRSEGLRRGWLHLRRCPSADWRSIVLTIVQSRIPCEEHPPALTGTDFVRNESPPRALLMTLSARDLQECQDPCQFARPLQVRPLQRGHLCGHRWPSAAAPHIGPVTCSNGSPGALCSLAGSELHLSHG
jgi:hypothetical protein